MFSTGRTCPIRSVTTRACRCSTCQQIRPSLKRRRSKCFSGVSGTTPAADGPTFLSQLLFYSAAISASKRVPSTGYRYALRVNPSSGNLHPTEFHFLTRGPEGVARWAVSLPSLRAHGRAARARRSRDEVGRQLRANRVCLDQHCVARGMEVP